MTPLRKRLSDEHLLEQMVTSVAIDALLTAILLEPIETLADRETGTALLGVEEHALGAFDLTLIPPLGNPPRDYLLTFTTADGGARNGFRVAVSLEAGPQRPLFKLIQKLPGHGLLAAAVKPSDDGDVIERDLAAGEVQIVGTNLFLVFEGKVGGSVKLRLSPNREAPDDVVVLQVQPPAVLIGDTGFGFEFSSGIVLDLADDARPADRVQVNGVDLVTPADTPSWQGIAVNHARFFLPKGVPFLGGHAVEAWLQIGLPPTPGIDLIIQAKVPPQGDRPEIEVRIECRDPTATGLDGFVPTLVEAVMKLPIKDHDENFGSPITFGAGEPVRARLRYARKPAPAGTAPTSEVSLALESQGADGLLKIDSASGGVGAKIAVTAATLATALIANGAPQAADGSGVILHELLVVATALSSFLDKGEVVLHGAELVTSGGRIPAGKKMQLKIDYSVAAVVTRIDAGVLSVQMQPNQPLRVRVREVVLTIDPEKSGLRMFNLDYSRSSLEVEDPGGWQVQGPDSLFDVLGTRSGRGSMWIEVDLRFKLDLGPVKVSGVTIRASLDENTGKPSASLRGLDASIALDPMISGSGAVELMENGFHAALEASIKPLGGIGASAGVETSGDMVKLELGVDLPGPMPLGNSGLAIYGVGGLFVANGKPKPPRPGKDPIQEALDWDYREKGSFVPAPAFSFGLEAIIGTAPDLGFTFSARAGLFITTPDIAVRGSLEGRYMGPRMKIARAGGDLSLFQAKGVIIVDLGDGVTIAVSGEYKIPHVVTTTVPVGIHFPVRSNNWFIHLGADGWTPNDGSPSESREGGPVRSIFLPELVGQSSDAYLMMRGDGISHWPRGGTYKADPGSFVITFGVGFDIVYGLKPILWADVFVRADILVSTNPMTFVGTGTVGGSLHIGIFSVGISASVNVVLIDDATLYLKADLCGTVDLFFDEIHKCVTLEYGSPAVSSVPPPSEHPLDGHGHSLVDDQYHRLAPLATAEADALAADAVWPDSIPLLVFSTAPTLNLAPAQFPDIATYPEGLRAKPLGGDLLTYNWELLDVTLVDTTGADVLVSGTFSTAWQFGKNGGAGSQPQPAELALMTPYRDLWLHALADAGAGLDPPPLDELANICRAQANARFGWALGASAAREGDAYRLPPESHSADPLQSQVSVTVQLLFAPGPAQPGAPLNRLTAQLLPLQFGYATPRIHAFPPKALEGRVFDAWLDPGASLLPSTGPFNGAFNRVGPRHELRIVPDDALDQAQLWLVFAARLWTADPAAPRLFSVIDDLGRFWEPDSQSNLDENWVAVHWHPPAGGGFVKSLTARGPVGTQLGILAIGGITQAAAAAAKIRNAANAAEAAKQAAAAADALPKAGDAPSPKRRCVLAAGRLYRIDVSMRWTGTLFEVDDAGKKKQPPQVASGTTEHHFWFRTAPLQPADVAPANNTVAHFSLRRHRQDLFDPAMLERHLLGYNPAQSELQRFAADRVEVHFSLAHVALLAGVYGFDLLCTVRRLDQPGDVEADQFLVPDLVRSLDSGLMTGSKAVIADAYFASACGLAPNSAVMRCKPVLARDTWYEVFVLAKSQHPEAVKDGRLPGVSFRTSRWMDASEMMAGLHFPISGVGVADGGVALPEGVVLAARTSVGDDGAFDAFLDGLGLDGWPAAADPRVSLLWKPPVAPAVAWICAGVLIESPEPIDRPNRFSVDSLQVVMGPTVVNFDIVLRDRSGSRLLFATTTPFVPRLTRRGLIFPWVTPKLRLRCTDRPVGELPKARSGLIEVPLQPSFSEEAQ